MPRKKKIVKRAYNRKIKPAEPVTASVDTKVKLTFHRIGAEGCVVYGADLVEPQIFESRAGLNAAYGEFLGDTIYRENSARGKTVITVDIKGN